MGAPFLHTVSVNYIDIRSKEFEETARKASLRASAESRTLGIPAFGYFDELDLTFKELPDNTLWEVELFDAGTHRVIRQVEPPEGGFEDCYPDVI